MLTFSKLTFLNAVLFPVALGLGACFFSDDDGLEDDGFGGTGGAPCPTGEPGCPCTGQGACDPGLDCQPMLNTCVLPEGCPIGDPGCGCTQGGACNEGFVCMQDICVSDMPCLEEDMGTESCQCTPGGGCDPGLDCLSNICVNVPTTTSGSTSGEPTTTAPMTTGPGTTHGGSTSTTSGGDSTSSTGSVDGSSGGI